MVAYSFKAQFAEPILLHTKRQTIRGVGRRRHAYQGEALQLYTGMRTRHCRLVARAVCLDASPIRLDLADGRVEYPSGTAITTLEDLNAFAVLDGFTDWSELVRFWRIEHAGVDVFDGVRILWGETAKAPEPAS